MKKHVLSDGSYRYLSDFLIALSFVELEITRVPGINDDALRIFVHGAPVVQRCKQLLAQVLAQFLTLKLRVQPDERQHMDGFGRQACQHGIVVSQIPLSAAQAGVHDHAQAPGPALGDAKTTQWRRDQRDTHQTIFQKQAQGRLVLQKVLFDQLANGRQYTLFVPFAFGIEQISERRVVPIGPEQQGTGFTGVTTVELADFARDGSR
ncbi:Divalent metal cation transporter [Pseudomonas syringae pv. actinidiae]|uniref:Divalent metal cation transporter n=1 Tax=Pseudomonas syringae pv. actinidiae TaxID=103796 RepID=A0AAN4Q9J4_PSESF|nr:Divalent metal cation transporter [Pseudomonas syringae pv. actinidiae]